MTPLVTGWAPVLEAVWWSVVITLSCLGLIYLIIGD